MDQCEAIEMYIADKRKQCGYTQQQVADYLKVSCQAGSKWEKVKRLLSGKSLEGD